jgi:hypothetical protein
MECLQHAHREAPLDGFGSRGVLVHAMLTCRVVISLNPRFPRPTISFDELRCCGQNQPEPADRRALFRATAGNDFRLHKHVEVAADRSRTVS